VIELSGATALSIWGALGSLIWIIHLIGIARHHRQIVWWHGLADIPPPGVWPRVAVALTARDEAAHIETAVRSVLAQDYPSWRLVAVDDRSNDETGRILDRLAGEDSRLVVIHILELPVGHLGKTHALQTAAESLEGWADWLLFTDADVVFAPGTLRRAVAFAEAEGIDHLVLSPEVPTQHWGERVFLLAFLLLFSLIAPFWKVRRSESRAHVGIGAFNLVRATAFHTVGGFRRLVLSVDDDMQLGRILKAAGYRTGIVLGRGAVSVRWHVGLWGLIRGLEKNFFAAARYSVFLVVMGVGLLLTLFVMPFVGVLVGPPWSRLICVVGLFSLTLLASGGGRQSHIGGHYVALLPLGGLALIVALARSTWITLRRGGVRWRDTFYPLAQLRDHIRRREEWVRELWLSTH
jgi:glycosyltransferase involved in cell wall biosynthesis